jgi:hypothetical protein
MSDNSVNLSTESPMDDSTAWDDIPTLPVPQHMLPVALRQELSGANLRSVALAPPISPRSALALMDVHDDIDTTALRAIARGLTVTLQQRDVYYTQQRRCHEQRIKELEKRVGEYKEVFDSVPEGFEENNGRLPNFSIPVGNGMHRIAKYIKQLEGGWVTGYMEEDGPHSTPHVIELHASPSYTSLDTADDPAEPMPTWFRQILFGHAALYSTLQKAILDLDDWGLYAKITRHRSYDIELGTVLGQIERLQLDAEAIRVSRETCEGRLTAAHAYKRLHHLSTSVGPGREHRRTVPWNKRPKINRLFDQEQV